jgi:hypothetical protein
VIKTKSNTHPVDLKAAANNAGLLLATVMADAEPAAGGAAPVFDV